MTALRIPHWLGRAAVLLPSRRLLPDLTVIAAILAVLWTGVVLHLRQEKTRSLAEAERNVANLSVAAEQIIARTIETIDQRIQFIREAYRHDRAGFNLDVLGASGIAGGATLQTAIIGKDGRLRMSSLGPVRNGVDLSDRAHFRIHSEYPETDRLFISKPVLGRESGHWSVQFTRKLTEPDGSFGGVVVISLDPYWLTQIYELLDIGSGAVTLIGQDQVVRGRAPALEGTLGKELHPSPEIQLMLARERGVIRGPSPVDGVERVTGFRHVKPFSLVILVGTDLRQVLSAHVAYRRVSLAGGAVLSLMVLVAGAMLIRHKHQRIMSRQTLVDAIENISQGLLMVDRQGRVPVMNRQAIALLQLPPALVASRPDFQAIVQWQIASGTVGPQSWWQNRRPFGPDMPRVHPTTDPFYQRVRPDGTVLEVRTQTLASGSIVRTFTDITEQVRSEERIRFLAHQDALTGLANRFLLQDKLDEALAAMPQGATGGAVLALDLDRFKAVNDTFGHAAGDQLLIQVASRLRAALRSGDTVARLGGDEFIIVQPGGIQPDAARDLATRVIACLAEPFLLDGHEARIGTSVGIALFPSDGDTAATLLHHADIALYRAKATGTGQTRLFEAEMEAELRARRQLEQDLRHALEHDGLEMQYQPIIGCDDQAIRGFEALLRWTHGLHGQVPPADFIPLAEETGLILPLGRWVLERACAEAASWPGTTRVAVNVSPAQFYAGDLPAFVAGVLERSGLAAGRLELEVTEGLLINDTEQVSRVMQALKAMGISIAVDDFGTGYASLRYLHRFPFDRLKLDGSFVALLGQGGGSQPIVDAILAMSRSLGLDVTAEGVETREQFDLLRRRGCTEVQGFLFSKPLQARQVPGVLRDGLPGQVGSVAAGTIS